MAETKDDGGPAFPMPGRLIQNMSDGGLAVAPFSFQPGMSLRDYFAAHAPEPFKNDTEPRFAQERTGLAPPKDLRNGPEWSAFWMKAEAIMRYQFADAMLSARTPSRPEAAE